MMIVIPTVIRDAQQSGGYCRRPPVIAVPTLAEHALLVQLVAGIRGDNDECRSVQKRLASDAFSGPKIAKYIEHAALNPLLGVHAITVIQVRAIIERNRNRSVWKG
jgi:hypothetical protein